MTEKKSYFYWFSVLGDKKEHDFNEVLYFRWNLTKRKERLMSLYKEFKKMLEYNFLERDTLKKPLNQCNFKLTDKGYKFFQELRRNL